MKILSLLFLLMCTTTHLSIVQAFEEMLPESAHRICLSTGEGYYQDAQIYLGCVQPGMSIEAENWTRVKIPALGHSWQMVSTVTDGKNWYMAHTAVSTVEAIVGSAVTVATGTTAVQKNYSGQYIQIGIHDNPNDSKAPKTSNWSNDNLSEQMGKSLAGVGLATDQNRWCIANTTGTPPFNIYIGCTTNLENVGNPSDWINSDISGTQGKSLGAVDLATDGINWAMSGTEGGSYDIHVSVMVNPSKDVLDAKNWKDVEISDQLGEASTPMDIATDGKLWCIANTTGGGDKEIYIGCTQEQGQSPAIAKNWKNVNLSAIMGRSDSGLSLATDGIIWCMGNTTGGGWQDVYLGCTRPGSDPLELSSWKNYNLDKTMGKSVQGADVAFYRSCYYPGEKTLHNKAPNHACCEGLNFNSDTNRCELPDFPPDVKDWVATQNTGCQATFADKTQLTFSEVARRLRLFHLMFASDKAEGMATFTPDQQDKYITDLVNFTEQSIDYKKIHYGESNDGPPTEMGDALIETATFQKETLKNAYQEYDTRLKTIAKAQEMLIAFIKKGADKTTPSESKQFGETMCALLFPNTSYTTTNQGPAGALATCKSTYAPAPQTMAMILDEQSLNNQAKFYKIMELVFTKSQILFENVTRLAKNETWTCSHSTTMQCGSKRVFDMDKKIFYINPPFPHHHAAYNKLGIKPTTRFSGNPNALRGTKAISGDKIMDLQKWYESKEFTDLEGKEYSKILDMLIAGPGQTGHADDVSTGSGEVKGAFDFFQMLTEYRIMSTEEVGKEKLPALSLLPTLANKKIFFRKDLMAYVIDLEIMNNFLVNYFQTGSTLASNQAGCVGNVAATASTASGGGVGFSAAASTGIGSGSQGTGVQAQGTAAGGSIIGNNTQVGNGNISAYDLGAPSNGGQATTDGSNHSSSTQGGNLTGGGNASLNAVRNHMQKRLAKFLKFKSTKAGENFAKNVKDGLDSYNKRVANAMKAGAAYNSAQMAASSAGLGAPTTIENPLASQSSNGETNGGNPTGQGNSWQGNGSVGNDGGSTPFESNNSYDTPKLSDEEKNRLLSGIKGSDYSTNQDDSLFEMISRRYMISGVPRLLMKTDQTPEKSPAP